MPQHNLKVTDSIEIKAPLEEIFRYFTDAEKIAKWWSKAAICQPKQNGLLIFKWENGTQLESHFKVFTPEKLAFPFGPEFVEVNFKTVKDKTFISVTHSDIIIKDTDFSLLIHITQSWSFLLINLKMVIEHNIDLR